MSASREISCTACGGDSLVRVEPVYEGFQKVGERFICVACGHAYSAAEEVPFKEKRTIDIFTADEKPKTLDIFSDDEKGHTCRLCRHYIVNPFTQRCSLHDKTVEATDTCFDFEEPEGDD